LDPERKETRTVTKHLQPHSEKHGGIYMESPQRKVCPSPGRSAASAELGRRPRGKRGG